MTQVKVRFAPSPTGLLHVGNVRVALINWLLARQREGIFYLRFDDTDKERSRLEYVEAIKKDLHWLGLSYEKSFYQSDRLNRYQEVAELLKQKGRLYPCFETPEELDLKRKYALSQGRPPIYDRAALKLTPEEIQKFEQEGRRPHWRFKLEDKPIVWNDSVRSAIEYKGEHLSDPVLIKPDGSPLYTFASVVDDFDMEITHIIRGEDHITNTAVQIQLLEALGGKPDQITFGHLSLLTDIEGKGLSKRLGSLSVQFLREEMQLEPMAINSYLARLGTAESIVPEPSLNHLISSLDFTHFSKATPKFDLEKLKQLNSKLLHHLSYEDIEPRLQEIGVSVTPDFWEMVKENLEKLPDIHKWIEICFKDLLYKTTDKEFLEAALSCLPQEPWSLQTWQEWVEKLTQRTGRKGKMLYQPLRQALTGEDHGPKMQHLILFLGYEKVKKRLSHAHLEMDS